MTNIQITGQDKVHHQNDSNSRGFFYAYKFTAWNFNAYVLESKHAMLELFNSDYFFGGGGTWKA